MYNYHGVWENFENDFNKLKNICYNNKDNPNLDFYKTRYKEKLLLSSGHISVFLYFNDKFHYSDSYIKGKISPYLYLFTLEEQLQIQTLNTYIKILGSVDTLLRFLNAESYLWTSSLQSSGVFCFQNPNWILERLEQLTQYFYVTKDEAIEMVIANLSLLTIKNFPVLEGRVTTLSDFLNIDLRIIKSYVRRYPSLIANSANSIKGNIEKIEKNYNIDRQTLINCFNKYPLFISSNIYKPTPSAIKKFDANHPYLLNFLRKDYIPLDINFEAIIPEIEKRFGVIEDALIDGFESYSFGYLIVKAHDPNIGYYLLGIGDDRLYSNNPTKEMLFNTYNYYDINGLKGYILTFENPLSKEFDDVLYQMGIRRYYDVQKYKYNYDKITRTSFFDFLLK